MSLATPVTVLRNGSQNKLMPHDRAAHEWYRFVLSFPPHLVRQYLERLEVEPGATVLDPFCGTGTTLVECKKRGISSIGLEAHPMARFASGVKTRWSISPAGLFKHAQSVGERALRRLRSQGFDDAVLIQRKRPLNPALRRLSPDVERLLLTGSISPIPLHKVLVLDEKKSRRSSVAPTMTTSGWLLPRR